MAKRTSRKKIMSTKGCLPSKGTDRLKALGKRAAKTQAVKG